MANGIAVAPCVLSEGRDDTPQHSNATYFPLKSSPRSGRDVRILIHWHIAQTPISMHRLNLLGRAVLERESGAADGPAGRPRPLALLALLAAAGPVGLSRDKCLVYLWPESDTRRARNSLHQTLHAIRTDLGTDAVDSGPPLTLGQDRFTVDLWEFDAALARGDLDTAVVLYAGPFLDGFALEGLPELEEWIETERLRVSRRYATALEGSARKAAERGDHLQAVHQWRVRAQLDPLSAPPALGLMRALVAAGDRESALASGHAYTELVRRELGCAPDPSIADFVATIRKPDLTPRSIPAFESRAADDAEMSSRAGAAKSPALPDDGQLKRTSARARRLLWGARVAAVLSLALLAASLALNGKRFPGTSKRSPEVIAVFPFTVAGSAEWQYLGNGLVDLLSRSLDGAGSIRGVDPHALLGWLDSRRMTTPTPQEASAVAARFGAGRYVLGSVAGSGTRLRLLASLYQHDRPDSAVASAVTEGSAADLFQLVDELTSQLLAASLSEPRHRLVRVAATTTPSLPALKSYLTGEQDLRAGRYVEAADAFQGAVRQDSSFALAYYRLAIAADWLGRDSLARSAGEAAVQRSTRLSEHDALLVNAAFAARQGNVDAAEGLYRRIVVDYPDDLEAWLQLGEVLFHRNPLRGRSATEARVAFARVLALDPDDEEAILHLARIAYLEGDRVAVDSLGARLLRLVPDNEVLELRAFRAFALSDRDSWKRVTRELLDRPPDVPPVTALQVALFLDDLEGAERFAGMLTDRRYSDAMRGLGLRLLARTAAARGRWDIASVQLDSARRFGEVAVLELRSLLASMDFLGLPDDEVRSIRAEVERWDVREARRDADQHSTGHAGLHDGIRAYRLGLLSARLGDVRSVVIQSDSLAGEATRSGGRRAAVLTTMAHSLRARAAFAENRNAEALEQLELADWAPIESGFEEEAGDRYLRAMVLSALGRNAEALTWFRYIAQRGSHELVYLASSRLHESLLACDLGDRASAAAAYESAARLWSSASTPLQARLGATGQQLRERGVAVTSGALPPGR